MVEPGSIAICGSGPEAEAYSYRHPRASAEHPDEIGSPRFSHSGKPSRSPRRRRRDCYCFSLAGQHSSSRLTRRAPWSCRYRAPKASVARSPASSRRGSVTTVTFSAPQARWLLQVPRLLCRTGNKVADGGKTSLPSLRGLFSTITSRATSASCPRTSLPTSFRTSATVRRDEPTAHCAHDYTMLLTVHRVMQAQRTSSRPRYTTSRSRLGYPMRRRPTPPGPLSPSCDPLRWHTRLSSFRRRRQLCRALPSHCNKSRRRSCLATAAAASRFSYSTLPPCRSRPSS